MLKSARYPVSDPPKMSRMALVRHSIMKLLLDRDNVIIQNIPTIVVGIVILRHFFYCATCICILVLMRYESQ